MVSVDRLGSFAQPLAIQTQRISQSFNRIAQARRTASAAEDPAGLAVAAKIDISQRSASTRYRATNDALSVVNIALGTIGSISDISIRQQELAQQAANGTLNSSQREALDKEYQALSQERDRQLATATFNGANLFDGTFSQTIGSGDSTTQLVLPNLLNQSAELGGSIADQDSARQALESSISAGEILSAAAGSIGSAAVRLQSDLTQSSNSQVVLAQAAARITDIDAAAELSNLTASSIQQNATIAVNAQANGSAARAVDLLI